MLFLLSDALILGRILNPLPPEQKDQGALILGFGIGLAANIGLVNPLVP